MNSYREPPKRAVLLVVFLSFLVACGEGQKEAVPPPSPPPSSPTPDPDPSPTPTPPPSSSTSPCPAPSPRPSGMECWRIAESIFRCDADHEYCVINRGIIKCYSLRGEYPDPAPDQVPQGVNDGLP